MIVSRAAFGLLLGVTFGIASSSCCRRPAPTVADCDAQYAAVGSPPSSPAPGMTKDAAMDELFEWTVRCKSAADTCREVGRVERANELVTRCDESTPLAAKIRAKSAADGAK